MSKIIKVIDLLNKIANGEELPEEIKYDNTIWQYSKTKTDYYQDTGSTILYFFAELVIYNKTWLNDTVEIIEEQEEIDIQSIKEFDRDKAREEIFTYTESNGGKSNLYCFSLFTESCIIPKINELVQAVKQLEKKIKEEG